MKNSVGQKFMEASQHKLLGESDQQKGIEQPLIEMPFDESKLVNLPDPSELKVPNVNLKELIERRQTIRKYNEQSISLQELSYLLWCTQGIKKILDRSNNKVTFRTVPSAGARHPFETYLLINKVDDLPSGLYRYIATKHQLVEVEMDYEIADRIVEAALNQVFMKNNAVTFIWMADIYRTAWRYGERSYRYVLLDAGHVCQNLYLSAESIDCGVCGIAAFDDDRLNEVLGFDGVNQFIVYCGAVGKKMHS